MTDKEFLEKYGINGEPLWIVPMSYSADIWGLYNHLLYKPLGVFKTHVIKMSDRYAIPTQRKECELDCSEYKHLLCDSFDIPEGALSENYGFEDSKDCWVINFGNTELPIWEDNSRFHVFYTEKEAQKCYDKLLKRFNKNFSKYIKKLKAKIIKIDDEINHLVDQQEYIESILDKYREKYGEGYINSISHA